MKRLFTFGCSFTQYWRWPTWADALGRQFDHFENWGVCGSGNSLVLYSLIECDQRNHIGAGDTVYIMWTNTSREDRYVRDRWIQGGNVYWTAGNLLPEEYVRRFACERGYLIRDLATITAVRHLLEHWGCDWQFMSMVPLTQTNQRNQLGENFKPQEDQDVRDLYRSTLDMIRPSVFEVVFGGEWFSGTGIPDAHDVQRRDFHPTPQEHVRYLDHVFPGLLSRDSAAWMARCQEDVLAGRFSWTEPNRARRF
jgi:hypothetical protein